MFNLQCSKNFNKFHIEDQCGIRRNAVASATRTVSQEVGDEEAGKPADHCVTVRDRDTMEQVRIPIEEVKAYIQERIKF